MLKVFAIVVLGAVTGIGSVGLSLDLQVEEMSAVIMSCSCELQVQTVGNGVNVVCDGSCVAPADACDFFSEWLPNGNLLMTCACYPNPDNPYSCGDKDCEAGYEWRPGQGAVMIPVGATCHKVDCDAAAGCTVIAPPYLVLTHPCDC